MQKFMSEFSIFDEFYEFYSQIIFTTACNELTGFKDIYCSPYYFKGIKIQSRL